MAPLFVMFSSNAGHWYMICNVDSFQSYYDNFYRCQMLDTQSISVNIKPAMFRCLTTNFHSFDLVNCRRKYVLSLSSVGHINLVYWQVYRSSSILSFAMELMEYQRSDLWSLYSSLHLSVLDHQQLCTNKVDCTNVAPSHLEIFNIHG